MKALYLAAYLFLLCTVGASAQYTDTLKAGRLSSFEGYHFYVAYMQNDNIIQPAGTRLRLMMCTAYAANVSVRFRSDSTVTYKLSANSAITVQTPSSLEIRSDEKILDSVVEVSSDVPIAVYAMSSQPYSSDSYSVIPVSNWGTQYTIQSMANDAYGVGNDSNAIVLPDEIRQSEFLVIAAYDSTVVEYNLTYQSQNGSSARQWHSVTLKKGQCYMVKAAPIKPLAGDLTGSVVRANYPFAVISGHARSAMPQGLTNVTDSKDHLADWLIPDETLGMSYLSTPFFTDARLPVGDILRVVATKPQTHLIVYTERQDLFYTLNNPGDIQTIKGVDSPAWIQADAPVSVAQYMLTGWVGGSISYDPAMVIVPPSTKFVSRSVFMVPSNLPQPFWATQFQHHYVNIICDSLARYSLTLDGVNIGKSIAPELLLQKFRSSPYFWCRIELQPGKHDLSCDTMGFSGTLYGMGNTDSYAHALGFSMMPDTKDTIAPTFSVSSSCGVLHGNVNEHVDIWASSLAFVTIDADSTKNYSFQCGSVAQHPNTVSFVATPIDPSKDAQIFITARDLAGNGNRYRYYYRAPRFTQPAGVTLAAKTENDSLCVRVYVQSPTYIDTLHIISAHLSGTHSEFHLFAPSSYPITVLPKTGVDFQLCFTPHGQSGMKITDTVYVDLGCGVQARIPVKATSPISSLFVSSIDYGDVMALDSVCAQITVLNTGSRDATISKVYLDRAEATLFTGDLSVFLATLKPGDSLQTTVCFRPLDTMNLKRALVFENSLGVNVEGEIVGRGVRAIVHDTGYDFSSLRIGTYKDSLIVLRNTGNIAAQLQYKNQIGDSQVFLHSLASIKTLTIAPGDSVTFGVRFYPLTEGSYTSDVLLGVNDPLFPTTTVRCFGKGTVPALTTKDVWMDTVNLGSSKSLRPAIVYSHGSEQLSIDTIQLSGSDASAFVLQPSECGSQRVAIGDSAWLNVQFVPSHVGLHQAQLTIIHDANKSYFRSNAVVQLRGWGRDTLRNDTTHQDTTKHDTLAPSMRVQIRTLSAVCDSLPFTVDVFNNDSVATLVITSYRAVCSASGDSVIQRSGPISVLPLRSYGWGGVWLPPLSNGTLTVHVQCGKWSLDTTIQLRALPRSMRVSSVTQDTIPLPGRSMNLNVRGRADSTFGLPEYFVLHIALNSSFVHLSATRSTLRLRPSGPDITCNLSQTTTEIVVRSESPFRIDSASDWELSVPMMALLSTEQSEHVDVQPESGVCYNAVGMQAELRVAAACAGDLRPVGAGGFSVKQLAPQPVVDELRLEITAFDDQQHLTIRLVDLLGRIFTLEKNLFLRKDENSIILQLKSIPSGVYRLELQSWDDLEQFPIMLTK